MARKGQAILNSWQPYVVEKLSWSASLHWAFIVNLVSPLSAVPSCCVMSYLWGLLGQCLSDWQSFWLHAISKLPEGPETGDHSMAKTRQPGGRGMGREREGDVREGALSLSFILITSHRTWTMGPFFSWTGCKSAWLLSPFIWNYEFIWFKHLPGKTERSKDETPSI
jgi:hypothetical protein